MGKYRFDIVYSCVSYDAFRIKRLYLSKDYPNPQPLNVCLRPSIRILSQESCSVANAGTYECAPQIIWTRGPNFTLLNIQWQPCYIGISPIQSS